MVVCSRRKKLAPEPVETIPAPKKFAEEEGVVGGRWKVLIAEVIVTNTKWRQQQKKMEQRLSSRSKLDLRPFRQRIFNSFRAC